MRILIAESNVTAALQTMQTLTASQFVVDTADTGNTALNLIKHYEYDALLTNFTLPDMDACELLRRLRKGGNDMPVLVLSALSNTTGRVKALDHGADDVVCVPVQSAELVARVQAVVRRANGYSHSVLQIGALELDVVSLSLLVHNKPVHLTSKEFAVLTLLMLRRDRIISKESFLSHLYGGLEEPDIKIIDVFICKLRRKLSEAGADNVIDTIWSRGYILRDRASINQVHANGLSIASVHEILTPLAA